MKKYQNFGESLLACLFQVKPYQLKDAHNWWQGTRNPDLDRAGKARTPGH